MYRSSGLYSPTPSVSTKRFGRPRRSNRFDSGMLGTICAGIANAALMSRTPTARSIRGGFVPLTEGVGGRRLDSASNELVPGQSNTSCSTQRTAPLLRRRHRTRESAVRPGVDPNTGTPLLNELSPRRTVSVAGRFPTYDRGGAFTVQWEIPTNAAPGIYTVTSTVFDRQKTTSTGTNSLSPCARLLARSRRQRSSTARGA